MHLTFLARWYFIGIALADRLPSGVLEKRDPNTVTVNLAKQIGTPQHLGSGILYGIPLNNPNDGAVETQMPFSWLTDIGYNYNRGGGAAWNNSYDYNFRFKDALTYYNTVRKFNGGYFLLLSDLWGLFDAVSFPGDNGDWTAYDNFLTQVISDVKNNGMTNGGLVIEMWNEPDDAAWNRDKSVHLEMWGRGVSRLRSELPGIPISGPATSFGPDPSNSVFTNWMQFVKQNGTIPDIYTWHALDRGRTPTNDVTYFNQQRSQYGLPSKPINFNEYEAIDEAGPAAATFYLSQFERLGQRGVRGNWGKGQGTAESFHDLLANLMGPEDLSRPYYANGEYQVYKYYGSSMVGQRLATTTGDQTSEVYATYDSKTGITRVLTAPRLNTNTYTLSLSGWSSIKKSGSVSMTTKAFIWNDIFGEVDSPTTLGTTTLQIVNNKISFTVGPRTEYEAYAFEFK